MTPPRVSPALALLGLGLLAAVPWLGWVSGAAVSLAGGTALAVAAWNRRSPERPQAGWVVASGGLAGLVGLAAALGGAIAAGLWVAALGLAVTLTGTQLALGFDPPADGRGFPAPLSLRSNLAVAVDVGLQWLWQLGSLGRPRPVLAAVARDLRAAAERNREEGVLEDPRLAHPVPPALEKPDLRRVHLRGLGDAEHLTFESEHVPRDPEVRDAYLSHAANRTAHAWLWRGGEGPRPTLLCIHGYGMGRPTFDARAFQVPWLGRALGLDVALAVLPLHGARAIGLRSGAGFLDGHPLATNAAFEQAVWDLRRLAGWLRSQGVPALGVMGMSLGGYTTALLASLERGLACAIPDIPAVSLHEMQWRSQPARFQRRLEQAGITPELLSEAWASHAPLRHEPRVAPEGRLIVAGLLDRICPPDQAEALWSHWNRPPIHWFPGSHLAPLGRAARRERIGAHLRDTLSQAGAPPPLTRFRRP